jgi:hypothetical protein
MQHISILLSRAALLWFDRAARGRRAFLLRHRRDFAAISTFELRSELFRNRRVEKLLLTERDVFSRVELDDPLVASTSQPERSSVRCFASIVAPKKRPGRPSPAK